MDTVTKSASEQAGQILAGRADPLFSPWFLRRGDYVRLTADLLDRDTAATLEVRVYTKNRGQSGNGTEIDGATAISLNSIGRSTLEWGPETGIGVGELVRYRFENTSTDPTSRLMFRTLSAVWFDAVRAN